MSSEISDTGLSQAVIKEASFIDTLTNVIANLGTDRDKAAYTTFIEGVDLALNRQLAEVIYRFQWTSKIIDIPPIDMTRHWRKWESKKLDPDKIKEIEDEEKRLEYKSKMKDGLTWGRLYGGCAVVIMVDGHGDASIPLDVTRIQKGQLKGFRVVDKWRIFPQIPEFTNDPFEGFLGEPENYLLMGSNQLIHRSRLVKFIGTKAPYWPTRRLLWWGDSSLTRLYETFKDTGGVISNIAAMTYETNVDIIRMKELVNQLSAERESDIKKRFELMSLMKSINNLVLLDSEDEYERKGLEFKALPDIMKGFLALLSAASDIPVTRLLGTAPSGLGTTDENALQNYDDLISGKQENELEPEMRYLDQAMIRSLLGDYPDDLDWTFSSLRQMDPEQTAELELKKTQKLLDLQALGVPDEVILKDIQKEKLSQNLDDAAIKKALAEIEKEIDEDEAARKLLENENNEPEPTKKPDDNKPDKTA